MKNPQSGAYTATLRVFHFIFRCQRRKMTPAYVFYGTGPEDKQVLIKVSAPLDKDITEKIRTGKMLLYNSAQEWKTYERAGPPL